MPDGLTTMQGPGCHRRESRRFVVPRETQASHCPSTNGCRPGMPPHSPVDGAGKPRTSGGTHDTASTRRLLPCYTRCGAHPPPPTSAAPQAASVWLKNNERECLALPFRLGMGHSWMDLAAHVLAALHKSGHLVESWGSDPGSTGSERAEAAGSSRRNAAAPHIFEVD